MFEYIKSTALKIGSGVAAAANYVAPYAFSVGRVVSSAGQSAFSIPKFVKYLTNSDDHPYTRPLSIGGMLFNIIVNLATRVPSLFFHYRKPPVAMPVPPKMTDPFHESDPKHFSELNIRAKAVYIVLRILCTSGGAFQSLSAYLNTISVSELLASLANSDAHDEEWKEWTIQAVALYFALSSLDSFRSLNLKKINERTWQVAVNVHNGHFVWDNIAKMTLAASITGALSGSFYAYFSSMGALGKIPYITIQTNIKRAIAAYSSVTMLANQMTVYMPAVYDGLRNRNQPNKFAKAKWESPTEIFVNAAGVGDTLTTGVSFFTGIVTTLGTEFGADTKSPYVIVPSIIFSSSAAVLNYFFSVHESFKDVMKTHHLRNDEIPYKQLSVETQLPEDTTITLPTSPVDIPGSYARLNMFSIHRPQELNKLITRSQLESGLSDDFDTVSRQSDYDSDQSYEDDLERVNPTNQYNLSNV